MDHRSVPDPVYSVPLDRKALLGHDLPSAWWLSADSLPRFPIHTGDNSAGNGGKGYFAGSLINSSYAGFEPLNVAWAGGHATALAHQTNIAYFDQSATQIAGVGGDGGNWNAALGGSVGTFGSVGTGAIATGHNSAGNGGDGYFFGAMVHAPVAVYAPINIAVAGYNSSAHADQANNVVLDQSAFQMAGVGGDGGNGNAAIGGGLSVSGHGGMASNVIASGDNQAGNGGDGYAYGGFVHASFALYYPINIAVAGYNSTANAEQTNNVVFDQSAFQMAGVGGDGGNGNHASGGTADIFSSIFDLIGSDVIATGNNGAGNGGNGHFSGSLVDIDVAIYAPINIAIAGYNSTAEAYQSNNVQFDQSTIQIAGIGGDGGHGNTAFGGDFAMHLLSDLHLLDHA
ncbi:hypothetical protein ACH79_23915 [Bradyrhizobium sp. CCBAU 051011]|uniref:hypothetical protein n=1 Tax=Bradyrhizobium sp. CCBAU 051011 TaxID=858422 RepID=UPI00137440B6|nr:hypothetical protein [Bradyrhizobium sp. CCBAU 051011]QHO75255.1 hypothetical protein ACH79_23915 [Bradyrhizobium sp. CCBAU 051011]